MSEMQAVQPEQHPNESQDNVQTTLAAQYMRSQSSGLMESFQPHQTVDEQLADLLAKRVALSAHCGTETRPNAATTSAAAQSDFGNQRVCYDDGGGGAFGAGGEDQDTGCDSMFDDELSFLVGRVDLQGRAPNNMPYIS